MAKLWHLRLGHAPFQRIKLIFLELDIQASKNSLICTICPSSRQSRLPFLSSSTKSKFAFDLLHVDIWGPYANKTYNGCQYFLTVVDEFTRMTWLLLMHNKNDCVDLLNNLFSCIKTQFNKHVKAIRSDNA